MATSIQVTSKTLKRLKKVKEELKAKTYEEVIDKILDKKFEIPTSLFGACPWMTPFTEEDRFDFDSKKTRNRH